MKNRSFHDRAGFALAGWRAAWRRERSFRTQVGAAVAAGTALLVLRPEPVWWGLVALTTALVLALELVNSAMEAVIDRVHPEVHPEIGMAKDMLAGAVLAISCAALAIAAAMVVRYLPVRLAEWGLVG